MNQKLIYNKKMEKKNILIVEDHALTRFALSASLKDEDFINQIFEAKNAYEGYEILSKEKIDVILMDLGLPGVDGIDATIEIRKKYSDVKVIVITSHNEEKEVQKCLKAGINAYCSKDIKPDKLINLIKDVIGGAIWFDSNISEYVLNMAKEEKETENKKEAVYNLTSKELMVLNLLAEGNSNLEIAKKLNISVNTTKVHVCSILQKLSVDDRTQAAVKALKENITG